MSASQVALTFTRGQWVVAEFSGLRRVFAGKIAGSQLAWESGWLIRKPLARLLADALSILLRWRALVRALRRWAGTVQSGVAQWEYHAGELPGQVPFSMLLPPPMPAEPACFRVELEAARCRLISGVPLAGLRHVSYQGAVIRAQLKDGLETPRPAVLIVGSVETGATLPPALTRRLRGPR